MDEATASAIAALTQRISELEKQLERAHPTRWNGAEGAIGAPGVRIHPSCKIIASGGRTVRFGERVLLRRGAEIVGPVTIGEGCSFNRDVYIRANVTFGKNCNIGAFARFITDTHAVGGSDRRAGRVSFPGISIGDGTWVGAGVTVLGGVTVGAGAVIAAGAVVTKDVPANTVVGGIPARVIRSLPGPR